ncbi:MAG: dihydrofolate reductase family protein [Brachybacterium sp.]|nr:dihydrofolate reductase family protein [Brachybacterium sp.]
MHLTIDGGELLPAPLPIRADDAGAEMLAERYAFPADRPFVRAMMNTTIDGAIAGADGTSGSLHNPDDSFLFGVLRTLPDVILVGAETTRVEDYRRPGGRRSLREPSRRPSGAHRPAVAVMSVSGDVPTALGADWPTYVLTPSDGLQAARNRCPLPANQVYPADTAEQMLDVLAGLGLQAVQCEGGPSALARFAAAGLLDELCFSVSHRTVGGPSPRVMDGDAHDQAWYLETMLLGEHATMTRYRRA